MKYYLIGSYPPPLGGVSVYVYRFSKLLKSQGHSVVIIDLPKYGKLQKILLLLQLAVTPESAVFYLNGLNFYVMLVLILRPFPGQVVFHDHSGRAIEDVYGIRRIILKLFLRRADKCILVGEHLRQYYQEKSYKLPQKTFIQNAFLPPPLEDEPEIWNTYDETTRQFIENHSPLIVANAFQIIFYQNVDLYGIDMCVELTAQLKKNHPKIGFLFALAEIGDEEYLKKLNQRIDALGIRNNFHFLTGQKELWPLFKRASLMIRPTYVDGYGISVTEALYFGCPAIASDVCKRAEGTVIFKNRDSKDLMNKAERCLK
jgi:glycosyltransferase involved in cell wall biosynthesis